MTNTYHLAASTTALGRSQILLGFGQLLLSGIMLFVPLIAMSEERSSSFAAGPAVGSPVTSFYVRTVTGPFAGKSICYVCRNGDRPVVMVFLRNVTADSTRLLRQLNQAVNQHRAEGLRCFVVLFSESPQRDSARLQTLSFDEKLDIPLTIASESLVGAADKRIDPSVDMTVVLYDRLKVSKSFSFRDDECTEEKCQAVVDAAVKMSARSTMPVAGDSE